MYSAGVVVGRNHDEVTTAMAAGPAIEQVSSQGTGGIPNHRTQDEPSTTHTLNEPHEPQENWGNE